MSTVELKASLHELIDGIQNSDLLESIHDILVKKQNSKEGHLWNILSESQKQEVLEAYDESDNPDNLTPHEQVLHKYK